MKGNKVDKLECLVERVKTKVEKLEYLVKLAKTKSKKIGLRMFYKKYQTPKEDFSKCRELWDLIKIDLEQKNAFNK